MSVETPTGAVVVLSTAPNEEEGARIARALVEERLAACVNLVPQIRSIYRWQDAVQDEREVLLVIKTQTSRQAALVERIRALHSYTCPEAVVLPLVAGSQPYLDWLAEVTG